MEARVPAGASVQCRIMEIKFAEAEVVLCSKQAVLNDGDRYENLPSALTCKYFEVRVHACARPGCLATRVVFGRLYSYSSTAEMHSYGRPS